MVDVGGAVYVRFDSFQARMEGQPTQMAFLEHMQPGSRSGRKRFFWAASQR